MGIRMNGPCVTREIHKSCGNHFTEEGLVEMGLSSGEEAF